MLQSYNGYDGRTREARLAQLRRAKADGSLPPHIAKGPGPCEICGQVQGTMFHAEEYGPTWEAYLASFHALCGHCHAMLHLRFRYPNRWRWHLKEASEGSVRFVTNMGVIFALARTWDGDRSPTMYKPPKDKWFAQLKMS